MKRRAFTLIELIMIIVILGILAVVAIPRYIDLSGQARQAAEAGVVGGVRGGIHTSLADQRVFPATLETAGADTTVFEAVLEQGIPAADGWTGPVASGVNFQYTGPTGATYTYYTADTGTNRRGSFVRD